MDLGVPTRGELELPDGDATALGKGPTGGAGCVFLALTRISACPAPPAPSQGFVTMRGWQSSGVINSSLNSGWFLSRNSASTVGQSLQRHAL